MFILSFFTEICDVKANQCCLGQCEKGTAVNLRDSDFGIVGIGVGIM